MKEEAMLVSHNIKTSFRSLLLLCVCVCFTMTLLWRQDFVSLWIAIKETLQSPPYSSFWVQLAQHSVWQDAKLFPGTVLCCWCGMALTCHITCGLIVWMFYACRHPRSVAGRKRKTAVCVFIFYPIPLLWRGGCKTEQKQLEGSSFSQHLRTKQQILSHKCWCMVVWLVQTIDCSTRYRPKIFKRHNQNSTGLMGHHTAV